MTVPEAQPCRTTFTAYVKVGANPTSVRRAMALDLVASRDVFLEGVAVHFPGPKAGVIRLAATDYRGVDSNHDCSSAVWWRWLRPPAAAEHDDNDSTAQHDYDNSAWLDHDTTTTAGWPWTELVQLGLVGLRHHGWG